MSSLNLVPNEVKGYRIHPDTNNWTVVQVRVRGKESKNAGQEYETKMAYCKSPSSAVEYIIRMVGAIEANKEQQVAFDTTGVTADMNALMVGIEKATAYAYQAVEDLEKRLEQNGYNIGQIPKKFQSDYLQEDIK